MKLFSFFIILFLSTYCIAQPIDRNGRLVKKVHACFKEHFGNLHNIDVYKMRDECLHNFQFTDFCVEDVDCNEYCSDDFESYYLLNYWFETCERCLVEKPFLKKLSDNYPELPIVSLSRDESEVFMKYGLEEYDWIKVPFYFREDIDENPAGYPLTLLLNAEGVVVLAVSGGIVKEEKYERVAKFLDKNLRRNK